jgi:VanZ family protein
VSSRRWLASFLSFAPAIFWYGCITYLSNQPRLPGPGDNGVYDFVWFKSGHLVVYSVLALLLLYGISSVVAIWRTKMVILKQALIAWVILILLAAIDEFHQSFIPGRTSRVTDIFIDALGSGAVLFLLERYNAFLPRSLRKLKTIFGM